MGGWHEVSFLFHVSELELACILLFAEELLFLALELKLDSLVLFFFVLQPRGVTFKQVSRANHILSHLLTVRRHARYLFEHK